MCSVGFKSGAGQSSSSPTESINYFYTDFALCTGERKDPFQVFTVTLHALALTFGFTVIIRLRRTF